jgi:ATP-dependent helicase/nuclease subunit A
MLEAPLGSFATAGFIEEVDVDALKKPWGRHPEVTPADAQDRLNRAIARAEAPAPLAPVALVPVTQLQDFVACPRKYHYAHQLGLAETPLAIDFGEGEEAAPHDPRAHGIATHKVLERTPLNLLGQPGLKKALEAIAEEEGLASAAAVVEHALAFWDSDFGQQVGRAEPSAVFRELPFVLRIGKPGQQGLVLRGQIDLLLLDGKGTAHVVDHKTVHRAPSGAEPYSFQLAAYALAARKFAPTARAVKTGIAYLRDRPVKFDWETPSPDALEAQEAALQTHTRALLEAQREGTWEGRPLERCRALKCGYISRCHGKQS